MYFVSDTDPVLLVLYVPEQPVHVLSLTLHRRRLLQPSLLHSLNRREIITVRGQSYICLASSKILTSPSPPGECVPPAFVAGGGHTRLAERGVGGVVNILEDTRHRIRLLL
jgi:hypothetical protein